MIITLLLIIAKSVLFFFMAILLAIGIHFALADMAKSHPVIDRHAVTIMFWTTALAIGLPEHYINWLPMFVGCIPVALAQCRVAKKHHGRYPDFRIIAESIRNAKAPFIAARTRLAAMNPYAKGTHATGVGRASKSNEPTASKSGT
jgi:hypothetical protein